MIVADTAMASNVYVERTGHLGWEMQLLLILENAALHITFLAYNIGKEDEVIADPSIFIVTVNSILYIEKSGGKGTWT